MAAEDHSAHSCQLFLAHFGLLSTNKSSVHLSVAADHVHLFTAMLIF